MNKSLLTNNDLPPLFDKAALLAVDPSVAQGYIVLLGGMPEQSTKGKKKKKKVANASCDLGFAALVDGNVLEACFGINVRSPKSSSATTVVKELKEILHTAADNNESVKKVAVKAYQTAFRIVAAFDEKVKKLNFLTFCFKYGKLQRDAEVALAEAFEPLEQAIKSNI